ncbi:TOBE domain-containing protein [Streptomyces sp. NBC_01142]|uniref:TOBE domain-containing protein n=1 Tax=Streptomyces sp. NBC_01142 TaxID=2975865 RepID=UPI002250ADB1|nr:TOBE domain-containing protein [Streptomyces sp. NBC_01142]MCX4822884.1 TOBE domain-containing protein [Streptomyces sp. NBC_01142]
MTPTGAATSVSEAAAGTVRPAREAPVADPVPFPASAFLRSSLPQAAGGTSRAAVSAAAAVRRRLGIADGSAVRGLVTSTEVSPATGPVEGLSIRNRTPGTVAAVATGGAMPSVKVHVAGGELTAAITKDPVTDLGLSTGSSVVALIKAAEIALASA